MKIIKRVFILMIIATLLLGFSTVFGANNEIKLIEQQKKPSMTGNNIILIIIAIIETATAFLVISNHKDNKRKANLILLVIFGILTLCAIVANLIVNFNAGNTTIYRGLHYLVLRLTFVAGFPFVLSIICLPITILRTKSKK